MAGNYDDAPSRRMGYDADGTVGLRFSSLFANIANLSTANLVTTNNESEVYISLWTTDGYTYYMCLLFPEAREVDGVFIAHKDGDSTPTTFATSVNTTNGIDGAWVTQVANMPNWGVTAINYRNEITSIAVSSVVGVRVPFVIASSFDWPHVKAFHMYGTISPGVTPDRILFLDTENSDAVFSKPIDYAEVPRGQTQQRTIKIKNNSATKTINTVQMTAEDLYLNAGGWYTFSLDDVSYQATLNTIGNLGPGATKLIYVKQAVPDAETPGLQTGRLRVAHASLT